MRVSNPIRAMFKSMLLEDGLSFERCFKPYKGNVQIYLSELSRDGNEFQTL